VVKSVAHLYLCCLLSSAIRFVLCELCVSVVNIVFQKDHKTWIIALWMGVLSLAFGVLSHARAQQLSAAEAKQAVEAVLADEAFGKLETETDWEYVGKRDRDTEFSLDFLFDFFEGFFQGTAQVAELLLWVSGALLLGYLAYRIAQNRQWLQPVGGAPKRRKEAPPAELFGLDLRPQSLPDDLAGEALSLLRQGRQREALSLLYRGALVRLVNHSGMEIPVGATEGECLRAVQAGRPESEAEFFQRLTRGWLRMAYGHLSPETGQVEALCREWGAVYGGSHEQ